MESIAVPVSVNVEVRPVGADIGSLERAISGALAEVARQLWAEVIAALERSLVVPRGHVGCGGILRANPNFQRPSALIGAFPRSFPVSGTVSQAVRCSQ